MAFENVALERIPLERRSWLQADEFAFGRPASRFQLISHEIVSFFDLFRISRDEDAEPLAVVLVKLATLVVFGIAATTAVIYTFGAVVARAFFGFAG